MTYFTFNVIYNVSLFKLPTHTHTTFTELISVRDDRDGRDERSRLVCAPPLALFVKYPVPVVYALFLADHHCLLPLSRRAAVAHTQVLCLVVCVQRETGRRVVCRPFAVC